MGKKTEKARREELNDMSLFRLKRVAAQAGADAEKVRSCEAKSEVIELIIEKEFGDDDEPKRTKVKDKEEKMGKDKSKSKKDKDDDDEPKGKGKKDEDDEDDEPKGKGKGKKDEDDDEGDDEGDDDGDDDDEGDDDDDGDDDKDDGDDDDGDEDEKPKRQAVKKDDLAEKIEALTALVEELKSDIEGTTRFAAGAYLILKAALPILGKTVGTKGMTKKISEIVEKLFPPKSKDDDKEED